MHTENMYQVCALGQALFDPGDTAVSKTDAVCPLGIYVSIEETDRKQANDTVSDPMYDTCCEESKTE